MKDDTQHLDFLISQHVDGCLDATSKKTLEHKMVIDPKARELYREHREVQDVLDDWGSRIPLIHWDAFDQELAARLENETVGGQKATYWQKWGRISAIAASLLLVFGLGYAWRAMSVGNPNVSDGKIAGTNSGPSMNVTIAEDVVTGAMTRGSVRSFGVDEFPKQSLAGSVNIVAPAEAAAAELVNETIDGALLSVKHVASIATQPSSVTAEAPPGRPETPPFP